MKKVYPFAFAALLLTAFCFSVQPAAAEKHGKVSYGAKSPYAKRLQKKGQIPLRIAPSELMKNNPKGVSRRGRIRVIRRCGLPPVVIHEK